MLFYECYEVCNNDYWSVRDFDFSASHRTIISRRVKIDKVFPYSKYKFLQKGVSRCCASGILFIVYGLDVPWIIYGRLVFEMAPEPILSFDF